MAAPSEPAPPAPIQFIEREGYLEALVPATGTAESLRRRFEEILQHCVTRKPSRLLVDMSSGAVQGTTLQRYENGVIGARLAPYVARVAVVAPAVYIDPQKIGVTVARNRGLMVDVFSDREAALAWLMEP